MTASLIGCHIIAIHNPYNACEKWGRPLLFLGGTVLARIDSETGLRPHSFELRADRELAVEYLRQPWNRSITLMTVQQVC